MIDSLQDFLLREGVVHGPPHIRIVERRDLCVQLDPDHEGCRNRLHGDARHVLEAYNLERLQILRDIDGAALKELHTARGGRDFLEHHRVDRRLAAIVIFACCEDGLLAARELLQLVGTEARTLVLDELAGPRIVGATHFLALRAVVDGRVEIGVDLQQQRVRIVGVEGHDIFVLYLDVFRALQPRNSRIECTERAELEGPVPGPSHVLGRELIAPVALHTLAEFENHSLA